MINLPIIEPRKLSYNGAVLYKGPSQINGQPIVMIAVGLNGQRRPNIKTGSQMIQTYILPANTNPIKSLKSGEDASVCGDCPHRLTSDKKTGGGCYVNIAQGPHAVFSAYKRGIYEKNPSVDILSGRLVRLGAWGDPSAVPIDIWDRFLYDCLGWTGYSHQWKKGFAQPLKKFCMASVESEKQMRQAQKKGWRTFRIRRDLESPVLNGEVVCPASYEAGKKLKCQDCLLCGGGESPKTSVVIAPHGPVWKSLRLMSYIDSIK